ncbi:DMT family transporter [Saccharospirillum mangrovi]|uniref:DMT family transporter n=1 Tax=Saccharospirillum mangrovi TaxID=2161747 RepID=UPI000D368CA6|nr:DMT family transporter [Saccharospirillum mangrovi]
MSSERRAIGYALMAVLLWSTVATAFKVALSQVSVSQLMAGAAVFSILALMATLAIRGELNMAVARLWADRKAAFQLGLINPVIYYAVLFEAYDRLPAQVAQPVNYTWAITLGLLSVPLLGHKLTRWDLFGMVLGYSGVVFISLAGQNVSGSLDYFGLFLALFSTLLWAGYWLLNTRDERPPIIALFQNFVYALPLLIVWMLWRDGLPDMNSGSVWASLAYVGVFEMGVTFVFWQLAMHHTNNASRIGTLIFLSPFISLFLIHFVLGEPLQWLTFGGLGMIVAGLWIQQSKARTDQ